MKVSVSRLPLVVLLTLASVSLAIAQGRSATVISTRANLRETPSQSGLVKQEVPVGSEIRVLDNKGAWYVVRIADAVGWMHGNTFRFTADSTVEETTPTVNAAPTYPVTPPSRPSRVIPSLRLRAVRVLPQVPLEAIFEVRAAVVITTAVPAGRFTSTVVCATKKGPADVLG